jgi:BioD-like phosphotransacetylase family protein
MVNLYVISGAGLSGLHTICIGMGLRFKEEGHNVGYIKPVGNRYYLEEGKATDEDAAFMRQTLNLEESLDDICPVVLTPQLIRESLQEKREDLMERVIKSYDRISQDKDMVIIQGAYTWTQGLFLGLSARKIASALDASVILVERFHDVYLADNIIAVHDAFGDELLGTIFNIVPQNRESFIEDILAPRLESEGLRMLGSVPYDHILCSINVGDLARLLNGEILTGEEHLETLVEDIVVGAMSQEHALSIFRKRRNICVVTGGDRSDIQLAAMEAKAKCLVLTGNLYPSGMILGRAEELGIPVILVSTDTFTTAERAEMIIRSARTHEPAKLDRVRELIDCCVDLKRIDELTGLK